jgi:chromosome segregation ATPase
MLSIQHENDELHETLSRKQLQNEALRSDLESLQSKFDVLTIAKANLETRLEQSIQETATIRNQIANAPTTDPQYLQNEIMRLTKALESKTTDFDYVTARYQEASAAASESVAEVLSLKAEVERLKRHIETDVRAITWEGEKKALTEKVNELEARCKLLEERGLRIGRKD